MNRDITRAMIVAGFAALFAPACYAWPRPPIVTMSQPWSHFIGVGDSVTLTANETSGTDIKYWNWYVYPNNGHYHIDPCSAYDGTGTYPYSTRTIDFNAPGQWTAYAEATNTYDLSDDACAYIWVCSVSIDDDPGRDTDEYMEYQSATPADIYYTLLPASGIAYRRSVYLYIKNSSGTTIRSESLTALGVGQQHTTWDGRKDDETWAPPGTYTAEVEMEVNYGALTLSASHPISVYHLQILGPTGTARDVCFGDTSSGICTFIATGDTNVPALNSDLEWQLTNDDGSSLLIYGTAVGHDPDKGPSVTFTCTGLPFSNHGLGPKMLTLSLRDSQGAVMAEATGTIWLFFPKWNYNHDGGIAGTPNWFHYWKEGGVVADLSTQGNEFQYDENGYAGKYNYETDELFICPDAADYPPQEIALIGGPNLNDPIDTIRWGNDEVKFVPGVGNVLTTGPDGILDSRTQISPLDVRKEYQYLDKIYPRPVLRTAYIEPGGGRPWSTVVTWENEGADDWLDSDPGNDNGLTDQVDLTNAQEVSITFDSTGIDNCAGSCTHELKHQELFAAVRYPWSQNPPYQYDSTSDGDYVDNDVEANSSYHLCTKGTRGRDTYNQQAFWLSLYPSDPGPWDDNEFLAYVAGMTPGQTTPDEDWSDTDGKNWPWPP
jgi:hypothetical protein